MSNDPQWKTFQPPILNSDPAILDYKSMSIPKVVPHQSATNAYRNGTPYGADHFMDSPPRCIKSSNNFGYNYQQQNSPRNGSTDKFPPIGTFTGLEATMGITGDQQDQSANQGTRETGIIEKLLVYYFLFLFHQTNIHTTYFIIIIFLCNKL